MCFLEEITVLYQVWILIPLILHKLPACFFHIPPPIFLICNHLLFIFGVSNHFENSDSFLLLDYFLEIIRNWEHSVRCKEGTQVDLYFLSAGHPNELNKGKDWVTSVDGSRV